MSLRVEALKSQAIARLNDALRQTLQGGKIMMTAGINALPDDVKVDVLSAVRSFSDFTEDNDPHGEHEFGSIEIAGQHCFWKIDYYDQRMEYASEDAADSAVTVRVLTIMLATEY